MTHRLRALARRREALVALAAAQREELAAALEPAVRKLAALDRIVEVLRRRQALLWIVAAGLVLAGPRAARRWTLRAAPFIALLRRA